MADLTYEKIKEAARLLGIPGEPLVEGSRAWASIVLKAAGKEIPRSWPTDTPFYRINYRTLVYNYLDIMIA